MQAINALKSTVLVLACASTMQPTSGEAMVGNCTCSVDVTCCPVESAPVQCGSTWCEWNWINWTATYKKVTHDCDAGANTYRLRQFPNSNECLWQAGVCNTQTMTCTLGIVEDMPCQADTYVIADTDCP